jgi:hypothetical protein
MRTPGMMVKVMLPIFGLLLLAACNDSGSPAPRPRSTVVSMDAQAWAILYSPGMPAHPSPRETGGWYFDFPSAPGSVHYVTATVNMTASKSVSASIEITTAGTPTFEYALDANNTCVNPAHVRFLLQEKGDDLSGAGGKQFYRWWSINAAYELTPGLTTLTAQVSDLSQWLSVFGERADASAAATAGFKQAMNNLGAVGFSFGGGCFYGHGVRVSGGGARFAVTSYAVK